MTKAQKEYIEDVEESGIYLDSLDEAILYNNTAEVKRLTKNLKKVHSQTVFLALDENTDEEIRKIILRIYARAN